MRTASSAFMAAAPVQVRRAVLQAGGATEIALVTYPADSADSAVPAYPGTPDRWPRVTKDAQSGFEPCR